MKFQKRKRYAHQRMPGYATRGNTSSDSWKSWLRVLCIAMAIPVIIGVAWFRLHIIKDLPDIAEIENYSFKQATTITDRHGKTLYTLFEENRQYIPYEKISESFVNALIATEDQRFWTNPGIDRRGTLRAGLVDISRGGKSAQGGSTITQQLIKNMMLTPEKKIERKLKEIVLAVKLNKFIKKDINKKYSGLSGTEVDRLVKEKVLELYSNYIFLGNNSYGVETASASYFDSSAEDLTILESAILAGIPQAPSRYDPYNNRASLMGELVVTDTAGLPVEMDLGFTQDLNQEVIAKVTATDITFKRDDSAVIDYFKGLLSFRYARGGENYQVSYMPGRKDTVLARMYDEGYITESEFKTSFADGFTYEFKRGKVSIDAPHFVFWVIGLLEENYDSELLRKGGLTITTSLDFDIQKLAEQSILENEGHLDAYEVGNAAMVYLNSHDGDVLAYVGSKDYYNDDIDGQVDVIQSRRQTGSIIKPFVYALGFMNLALTIDSPIYDIKFTIGNNTPENADGKYKGLMALKNALAYSRNIPAIKMFFSAGGEVAVKTFLQQLGLNSLDSSREYGYPLAIGAGETPMIEMANAYAHLSAMGKPAEINPILEVRDANDTLLYKKQVKTQDQIIPGGVAYLIWDILSTKSNFPSDWVDTFSFAGINFATKSGTTNVKKGDEKLPRDAWLAAYTPSAVMLFWGGNTDGSALRKDAFGGRINSPIRKSFAGKLKQQAYIQNEEISEREVKSVTISKLSGKLSSSQTPLTFIKKSLGYIESLPTQVDASIRKFQIDTLCQGIPSELTPPSDIQDAYYISPESIMPDKRDQTDVWNRRASAGIQRFSDDVGGGLFMKEVTGGCDERFAIAELGEISLTIMQPTAGQQVTRTFSLRHQTKSPFIIKTVTLFLDDIELKSFTYNKKDNLTDISTVSIPEAIAPGSYILKVVAMDEKGYTDTQSVQIELKDGSNDSTPPYLMKEKIKVTKKDSGAYEVVMLFGDDASTISSGSISYGGSLVHSFKTNVAIFEIAELGAVEYSVGDTAGNVKTATITLSE